MALEKDNKGHREMSDKLDEKYKDSNVWNKVINLIIFYWLKLLWDMCKLTNVQVLRPVVHGAYHTGR